MPNLNSYKQTTQTWRPNNLYSYTILTFSKSKPSVFGGYCNSFTPKLSSFLWGKHINLRLQNIWWNVTLSLSKAVQSFNWSEQLAILKEWQWQREYASYKENDIWKRDAFFIYIQNQNHEIKLQLEFSYRFSTCLSKVHYPTHNPCPEQQSCCFSDIKPSSCILGFKPLEHWARIWKASCQAQEIREINLWVCFSSGIVNFREWYSDWCFTINFYFTCQALLKDWHFLLY